MVRRGAAGRLGDDDVKANTQGYTEACVRFIPVTCAWMCSGILFIEADRALAEGEELRAFSQGGRK